MQADGEAAEAIVEVFDRLGEGGAVVETLVHQDDSPHAGDPIVSVKTYLPVNGSSVRRRREIEEALWHLSQLYPIPVPEFHELTEEDWAEAWKKSYSVQHIGQRFVVAPSWESYAPQGDELILRLDPGMAFGTGLHPTTRLCLHALETERLDKGCVLDVGTGSGILAIAAAKLGARQVIGIDLDPIAVKVARENVQTNGVADRVQIAEGTLGTIEIAPHSMDCIVVNILADVIMKLAGDLATYLARGGTLIASGIIEEYANAVTEALASAGLRVRERRQDQDWVALTATQKD